MAVAMISYGAYAVLTGRAGTRLARRNARRLSRASGICLIGAGYGWPSRGQMSDARRSRRPQGLTLPPDLSRAVWTWSRRPTTFASS